jgi:hypothetical protein
LQRPCEGKEREEEFLGLRDQIGTSPVQKGAEMPKVIITTKQFAEVSREPIDVLEKAGFSVEVKDFEAAQKALLKAIPLIQKGHSKGVFHKNTTARKISRLTREVNSLKTKSP